MRRTGVDLINDSECLGIVLFLDFHLGVKMSPGLQIIEQVLHALIQQVIVDGIFLVNGDLPLEHATTHVIPARRNQHHRAGVDLKGKIQRIPLWPISLCGDRHLSEGAVLLLELSAQPLQRARHAGGGDAIATIDVGNPLDLSRRQARGSGHFHFPDVRLRPGVDVKQNVHLLSAGVGRAFRGYSSLVISVLLHHLADVLERAIQFVLAVALSELEFRGVDDLVCIRTAGRSLNVNGTHKVVRRGDESQHYAAARGRDFRLDIGKSTGPIECANTRADLVPIQRTSNFLRK